MTATTEQTTERVALDRIAAQIADLKAARDLIAELKEEEARLAAVVREEMGDGRIGTVGGKDAVRLDRRTKSTLDGEKVRALVGEEAYSTLLRLTPYTTLNFPPTKKRRP
jgi:hypothetical protein